MKSKTSKDNKKEIETYILPFIPKNKHGFAPKVDLADVMQCVIYKLKTEVQWEYLFVDIHGVKPKFSQQLVYYYYKKWRDCGVFYRMNKFYLEQKKGNLTCRNRTSTARTVMLKNRLKVLVISIAKKAKPPTFWC